jgi:predicted 3-demethylubiquinone-9 3-methyltransferase (glyoxalase superfamily)
MQNSTETRWILSETEFEVISNWFAQHKLQFDKQDLFTRQDYYLKLLKNSTLGIKIREPKTNANGNSESKLEIKIMTNNFSAQKFNNGNQGIVNSWSKFSFETVENELETQKIINSFTTNQHNDSWIKIDKDRLLLKYDVTNNTLVSGVTIIDEGAGIELTKFKIENKTYYSLGVEAFSMSNKGQENFNATINFLFSNSKISGLGIQNSISYPEIISNHFSQP